ncbi:riboflavin synthase [Halegenticoccus tardaugens]|uniref:riboflavin synthase n=1 Tax=Halegenticoccus tardaugens TaxID=2071624 RepID=UPI001E4142B6|nr:riboflavin synthase [Halegenticoccus tardaugens]
MGTNLYVPPVDRSVYTGIITKTGTVRRCTAVGSGVRLQIDAPGVGNLSRGDSVAVSGVCLTATRVDDRADRFEAFASPETLSRTYLGELDAGDRVNLEHPLSVGDGIHGHFVRGTVDATTRVTAIRRDGDGRTFEFALPEACESHFAEKGAVGLDGISLTVAALGDETFSVAVIPATYEITTLSGTSVGDPVHIETDPLAKYVERHMATAG